MFDGKLLVPPPPVGSVGRGNAWATPAMFGMEYCTYYCLRRGRMWTNCPRGIRGRCWRGAGGSYVVGFVVARQYMGGGQVVSGGGLTKPPPAVENRRYSM